MTGNLRAVYLRIYILMLLVIQCDANIKLGIEAELRLDLLELLNQRVEFYIQRPL